MTTREFESLWSSDLQTLSLVPICLDTAGKARQMEDLLERRKRATEFNKQS